jgi:SAM-dependent methyltransferase
MTRKEFREYRERTILRLCATSENHPGGRFDEQALPAYTNPNPFMRFVFWERVWAIAGILHRLPESPVALDFGSGLGLMLPLLAERAHEIMAVDVEPEKLIDATGRLGIALEDVRIERSLQDLIDRGCPQAGLVLAMDVLEHVTDLDRTLSDIARLMAPDGRLLVSGPTESLLYRFGRRLAGYSGHYHRRNIRDIENAMSPGFRIISRRIIFPWARLFIIIEARPVSVEKRRRP